MPVCVIPGFLLCPIFITLLFISDLALIYVTLYFLCPCKMPYVLSGARQGINT